MLCVHIVYLQNLLFLKKTLATSLFYRKCTQQFGRKMQSDLHLVTIIITWLPITEKSTENGTAKENSYERCNVIFQSVNQDFCSLLVLFLSLSWSSSPAQFLLALGLLKGVDFYLYSSQCDHTLACQIYPHLPSPSTCPVPEHERHLLLAGWNSVKNVIWCFGLSHFLCDSAHL